MERRLQGKVAVISASSQGIGYGIAVRLGKEGASVVISSRKQKNVETAVQDLRSLGIDAQGIACHVASADQRKELIKSTVDKFGRIDILVSNAAVNPSNGPIMKLSETLLDKLWEVNVKAALLLVQEAEPHMPEGSSIVFISSMAAYSPQKGSAMYGVTKTALLALMKGLAMELGPKVRVNCVAPGYVPTRFVRFLTENEALRKKVESKVLMKRLGTIEDMGAAVAFLVSDDASYITGETIVVAGGTPSRL